MELYSMMRINGLNSLPDLGPDFALLYQFSNGEIEEQNTMTYGPDPGPISAAAAAATTPVPTPRQVQIIPPSGPVGDPSIYVAGQRAELADVPPEVIGIIGEYTVERFNGKHEPCTQCQQPVRQYWDPDEAGHKLYENMCDNGHIGEVWSGGLKSLKSFSRCASYIDKATRHIRTYHVITPKRGISDTKFALTRLHDMRHGLKRGLRLQVMRSFTLKLGKDDYFSPSTATLLLHALGTMKILKTLVIDLDEYFHLFWPGPARDRIFLDAPTLESVESLVVGQLDSVFILLCHNVKHIATAGFHCNTYSNLWFGEDPVFLSTQQFVERIGRCAQLQALDMETDWDFELITSIAAVQPNLKRLGMMGNMFSEVVLQFSRLQCFRTARVLKMRAIYERNFYVALRRFSALETLVLPYITRVGVFKFSRRLIDVDRDGLLRVNYEESARIHDVTTNFPPPWESPEDRLLRARFDKAYAIVSSKVFWEIPTLKELWFDRFTGVDPKRDTDWLRDVRVSLTERRGWEYFKTDREVLLPRATDGTLSYGCQSVQYYRPADSDQARRDIGSHPRTMRT